MSPNNYNYNYPYHQQGSAYQTTPFSNTSAQSSRQYSQPHSAVAGQADDGLPHSGPSYSTSSTGHDTGHDNSWGGGNSSAHGTTRDNGSPAAEVLRNMSNTGYAATSDAPSQSGFTATNTASAYYASGRSPQLQAQPSQTFHSTYGQTQPRPRGINTNEAQSSTSRGLSSPATAAGYPSQRAPAQFQQQQAQQRTTSPAQPRFNVSNAPATSSNTAMTAAANSQPYSDYNRRNTDVSRSSHSVPPSNSYAPRPPAQVVQPPISSTPDSYAGSSTTVDPTAVYDPWPEYQRQQAIRDAERIEWERKEEKARKEREQKEVEERKQKETEEAARQAQIAAAQPEQRAKKSHKQQAPATVAAPVEPSEASAGDNQLEAEIRAMMAKMRELNGKDPALLARIWEEERRAKVSTSKSPTLTTKPAPHPAVVPPPQVHTPPTANQRKRAVPRASLSTPMATPATPSHAQAAPPRAPTATPVRTGGNTIWPPEKKSELARAAALYLSTKNPDRPTNSEQILQMLDGDPSYIELCEQLERTGFQLDRSVFAKTLLLAVPDVNSASRRTTHQNAPLPVALKAPAPSAAMKCPAPPAVMKNPIATPIAPSPQYAPASTSPMNRSPFPTFPGNDTMAAPSAIPVAEMIPIKPELRAPANKEEAARKRNMSELVDLTQLDDDEDMGPMKKRKVDSMYTYGTPHPHIHEVRTVDAAPVNNFPTATTPMPATDKSAPRAIPVPTNELRYRAVVEPIDKKKALRRNTYNPATIARDVLLACGRHPSQRQLNQHLDILRANIPQISNESDLSTIKWDLIDPGSPPPGYYKDSVQVPTEDADDEDESEEDEDGTRMARQGSSSHAESARVQALPAATNPFMKQKRRGRPPRQSLPNTVPLSTPQRPTNAQNMSASAPRPGSAAAGVGYAAFRFATDYGPDGKPLPKKKGRPVGWRKAIHGSSAAQQRPAMNRHTGKHDPQQSNTLRNVGSGDEPIRIDSRSPSVATRAPQYRSFKCRWQNCKAELHNLETLKLHVFKIHKKENLRNTLDCLWNDCGKEATSFDAMSNTSIELNLPHAFESEKAWRGHIQQNHFDPLAWEQGDGPAGGLSGTED